MNAVGVPEIDYLPGEGLIYLDNSAIRWVNTGSLECTEGHEGIHHGISFEGLKTRHFSKLNKALKRRGGVITTPKIEEEIRSSLDYYTKRVMDKKSFISSIRDFGAIRNFKDTTRRGMVHLKESKRMYKTLLELLKENEALVIPRPVKVQLSEAREFFNGLELKTHGLQKELSEADRELVSAAVSRGHNTGILTADKPLMAAYTRGVSNYGLSGCFISDVTLARTRYIITD